VLYVHPAGHLNDLVVPAGALSCMNGLASPRLGRFAFEVTEAEIAAARVVAIDLHWALAVPAFGRLVRHVRRIQPRAAIVAGGITAGIHARSLVDDLGVDFVVRGDSERAFSSLCRALLDDGDPGPIANVVRRGAVSTPSARMTQEDLDGTDCVSASWFPTYAKVSDWNTAAFSMARTIPVSRGCPMRCATCYGSYARTMGAGYLLRSPESLAREVARAADARVRNLRLILAKPPAPRLTALVRALATAGPFAFPSEVGLYLCTPPTAGDLDALEAAFPTPVALSVIPPEEHEPQLPEERVREEQEAWRRAAERVERSRTLRLDVWRTRGADVASARSTFATGISSRIKVNLGTTWQMTRPGADGRPTLGELDEIMEPLWTFYAARLLSPALASLLAPFRFLDDLEQDPCTLPRPDGALGTFFDRALESWRAHRLPLLAGLGFAVVPVHDTADAAGPALQRVHTGVRYHGATGVLPSGVLSPSALAPPVALRVETDHRAVYLRSEPFADAGGGVAFVPVLDAEKLGTGTALSPAAHGAVLLRAALPLRPVMVQVALRVQEAELALLDGVTGESLARGRVDLGFFTPPAPPRGAPVRR